MKHLLVLLSGVALLIWGSSLVRSGIMAVFGSNMRAVLSRHAGNRWSAAASGLAMAAIVQSSTATALIVSPFVAQSFLALPLALAVMLGADIGTGLVTLVFSFDLSWLSPLLVLVGVALMMSKRREVIGQFGQVLIGVGLMLLALRHVGDSAHVLTEAPVVQALLASISSDVLLQILVGTALTVLTYSSLAVVLVVAAMAQTESMTVLSCIGFVLGANLGSGLVAVITLGRTGHRAKLVPLGNFVFKASGVLVAAALLLSEASPWFRVGTEGTQVVLFHLTFNCALAIAFIGFVGPLAGRISRWFPDDAWQEDPRPHHLDPLALATPSLALACAAREAFHQADLVETMLEGMMKVIVSNDAQLARKLRALDDDVDKVYSDIKYYLTRISKDSLDEVDRQRWSRIVSFTINMEQIADLVERILLYVEQKKIRKGHSFSDAGMAEICQMHTQLVANLRIGTSILLNGASAEAEKMLAAKARFRALERSFAATHLTRLSANSVQSIETSSLHLDLISDMQRINSHICSIAYVTLEPSSHGLLSA